MATNENFDGVVAPALPATLQYQTSSLVWNTVSGIGAGNVLEAIGAVGTAYTIITNVVSASNQSFLFTFRILPVATAYTMRWSWRASQQNTSGFNYYINFSSAANLQLFKTVNSVSVQVPFTTNIPTNVLPNNIDLFISCFSAGARQYVSIQRADTNQYLTSVGTWSNILVYCFDIIDIDVPATTGGFALILLNQSVIPAQVAIDTFAHNDFTPIPTGAYNMQTNMANVAGF
jgi:hypothetical protein